MKKRETSPWKALWRGARVAVFLSLPILPLLQGCGLFPDQESRCGTDIPDPAEEIRMSGCAVHLDGGPAIGARVEVWPSGTGLSKPAVQTVQAVAWETTDRDGAYSFHNLESGYYDIIITYQNGGSREEKAVRRSGILFPIRFVGYDTLRPSGIVRGRLADYATKGDVEGAFCSALGTPYSVTTQTEGFTFVLPGGGYDIRCQKEPYEDFVFRNLKVESGGETVVRGEMKPGIVQVTLPAPAYLNASFDTVAGLVRLSWPRIASSEYYDFSLIRTDSRGTKVLILADTVYYDAVFGGLPDSVSRLKATYSIAGLKKNGERGGFVSTRPLEFVRASAIGPRIDSLVFSGGQDSLFAVGDTAMAIAVFGHGFRSNSQAVWRETASGDTLRSISLSGRSGKDTLYFPVTEPGPVTFQFTVTDESGLSTRAETTLTAE